MVPYTFQDGTHVPLGDWACVPQRALLRDSNIYPDATTFNGFRFVNTSKKDAPSVKYRKLTDLDHLFPIWGLGKQAW